MRRLITLLADPMPPPTSSENAPGVTETPTGTDLEGNIQLWNEAALYGYEPVSSFCHRRTRART